MSSPDPSISTKFVDDGLQILSKRHISHIRGTSPQYFTSATSPVTLTAARSLSALSVSLASKVPSQEIMSAFSTATDDSSRSLESMHSVHQSHHYRDSQPLISPTTHYEHTTAYPALPQSQVAHEPSYSTFQPNYSLDVGYQPHTPQEYVPNGYHLPMPPVTRPVAFVSELGCWDTRS